MNTLYIYGDIGGMVTDQYVAQWLSEQSGDVSVRISSTGGDWFQGLAIYNALKEHGKRYTVDTYVDSMALSVASVIFLAGKNRYMLPNTYLMAHNIAGVFWGEYQSDELRRQADLQDKLLGDLVGIYLNYWQGQDETSLKAMLQQDTFLDVEEAIAAGLATASVDEFATNRARCAVRNQILKYPSGAMPIGLIVNALRGNAMKPKFKLQHGQKRNGAGLAGAVLGILQARVSEDMPLETVIADVATAAGVEAAAISEMIDAESAECPTADVLLAVATALDTPVDTLKAAAESDGCAFADAAVPSEAEPAPMASAQQATATARARQPAAVNQANSNLLLFKQFREQETDRKNVIRNIFRPFVASGSIAALQTKCLDDLNISAADAKTQLLNALGNASGAGGSVSGGFMHVAADASDKLWSGLTNALSFRAGIVKRDPQNNYNGIRLANAARLLLQNQGRSQLPTSDDAIVRMAFQNSQPWVVNVGEAGAHTTSDFGNLLANVAEKAMLMGWEETEETYEQWTSRGEASDFKSFKRVGLGEFPDLDQISEDGEYQYGKMTDYGETAALLTFGKLFHISRQAIINDDLNAFTRIPNKMGRAARRKLGTLAYNILFANAALADGIALFNASHGNTQTAAAPSVAAISTMRTSMATQSDPDGNVEALNIDLRYIICGKNQEDAFLVIQNSEFDHDGTAFEKPNSQRNRFITIADARVDNSANPLYWFGAADPGMHDTVEMTFLNGNDAPFLDQHEHWTVDGTSFKVRIDAVAKALDFRALQRNVYAG